MAGDAGPTLPQEPGLAEVEALVRGCIDDLAPVVSAPRPGRPAILPATCLWGGLLVCVLQGFSSQLALWRLLTQVGLWSYPRYARSDQAVYHRLARDGAAPLEQLFQRVRCLLAARLTPALPALGPDLAPFATEIVALDETTLDPLARRLPARECALPLDRRLPGTLAGLFDVRRQQWRTLWVRRDVTRNEKVLARALVASLPPGSLILADLGYFGFRWFDDLTDAGHWWVSRLRSKTSYRIAHLHAQHGDTLDALVWLGTDRADRTKHLARLIPVRHGGQVRRYITNVRDPGQLRAPAILDLDARRWDIEGAVDLVTTHLGLHLWWSTKDVVIQQQRWAVLTIAQILQALRLEIAVRAKVAVFEVSIALLVQYLPRFAQRGADPVAVFVERGQAAGFIRPSRRIRMTAPDPPELPAWSCASIEVLRTPRYAGKT